MGRIAKLAAALIAFAALIAAAPAGAADRWGAPGEAEVPTFRMFDLGVTDADGDGFLDVFTTNHKFHPGLLRNDGFGNLTDVTNYAGLSQTPEFPGLEYLRKPTIDTPGRLHLRDRLLQGEPARGHPHPH